MNNAIVSGSLSDIAQTKNQSLAESFLNAEMVILLDNSGSMATGDAPGKRMRREMAEEHLTRIQGKFPGKVALICFADDVQFVPDGNPTYVGVGTNIANALQFIHIADDCDLKIVLVSDGEPDNKQTALDTARQFESKIDTIFCGPEDDIYGGRRFLQKLADITGGQFFQSDKPGMLADSVETLLLES